jgi:hypothetical protein
MRKFSALKATLFAASALLMAAPAAAQPGDDHDHGEAQEEQPARPRDPIAEPTSTRTEHRVQMQAGQRYVITADSEAFDAMLRLLRPGSTEPLAEDDDSGGGTTPRIVYTPQTSGEYIVQVSSFTPSGHGEYALSVTQQTLPPLVTRPTRTERSEWQVYQGELAANDAADMNRKFDDYELRLNAGQTAMIHVVGTGELDTMLQVFTADGRGVSPLVENDDGGGGVNPFLLFAPDEAGTYIVRVIGYDNNASGAYRLRISR